MSEHAPESWEWGTTEHTCERGVWTKADVFPRDGRVATVRGDTPEEAETRAQLIASAPNLKAENDRLRALVVDFALAGEMILEIHDHPERFLFGDGELREGRIAYLRSLVVKASQTQDSQSPDE